MKLAILKRRGKNIGKGYEQLWFKVMAILWFLLNDSYQTNYFPAALRGMTATASRLAPGISCLRDGRVERPLMTFNTPFSGS